MKRNHTASPGINRRALLWGGTSTVASAALAICTPAAAEPVLAGKPSLLGLAFLAEVAKLPAGALVEIEAIAHL